MRFGVRCASLALLLACASAPASADVVTNNFGDHVEFTVTGAGASALTNFPLMVRLSESLIPGFSYTRAEKDELAFVDAGDLETALAYDVDTWNASGESVVWVKVPVVTNGTTIVMNWYKTGAVPANNPADVWSGYAGVWHMADGSDASGSNAVAKVSSAASLSDSIAGGALSRSSNKGGPFLTFKPGESVESLTNKGFVASMWVRLDSEDVKKAFLFGRRKGTYSAKGWGVSFWSAALDDIGSGDDTSTALAMFSGSGSEHFDHYVSGLEAGRWMRFDFVFTKKLYQCWLDGELKKYSSGSTVVMPINGSSDFAIGGAVGNTASLALNGSIDEFRLRPYDAAADNAAWIAAEYANVSQTNYVSSGFLSVGEVSIDGGADYWAVRPSVSPAEWEVGEEPVFVSGSLHSGDNETIAYAVTNLAGGAEAVSVSVEDVESYLRDLPKGEYRLCCTADGVEPVLIDLSVKYAAATAYDDHVEFVLNGIASDAVLTNYTLLVKVSETELPGFSYVRAGKDGSMLLFMDEAGHRLFYDVERWDFSDETESIIWVKVPEARRGDKVTMYWCYNRGTSLGNNDAYNASTNVWSDYAGVWHMNDATDASGNSAAGTLHSDAVMRTDGAIGMAYGRTVTGPHGPIASIPSSDAMDALTGGVFTVSGWIRLNSPETHWANIVSRSEVDSTDAWRVRFYNYTYPNDPFEVDVQANADSSKRFLTIGKFTVGEWDSFAVEYTGTSAKLYINGVLIGEQTGMSTPRNADWDFYIGGMATDVPSETGHPSGTTSTLNGDMDEVRLYKGAVSLAQTKAEYANATQSSYRYVSTGSFMVPSLVTRNGDLVDYWLSEPTISRKIWEYGKAKDVAYTPGVLRSGADVSSWCVKTTDPSVTNDVSITTLKSLSPGSYRIWCRRSDKGAVVDGADDGYAYVDFTVVEPVPVVASGDTKEGRILLMNNHWTDGYSSEDPDINCQGWANTNAADKVYWEHSELSETPLLPNLQESAFSTLYYIDDNDVTNVLWRLENCRHGNTYPADNDAVLDADQNYLPFSSDSASFKNTDNTPTSRDGAGQVVMRNIEDAAVYSPFYTNGIGTVYFDAVNGWTDNIIAYTNGTDSVTSNAYRLVVETNASATDDDSWVAQVMYPVRVRLGAGTVLSNETSTVDLPLAVASGGTTNDFYRVYVPLNEHGSLRFRIRRVSVASEQADDSNSYILIDNIIVSRPAASAELGPAGPGRDPDKRGENILGFEGALDPVFPAVGDTIYGRAAATYTSGIGVADSSMFASAKMHYRWRYLDLQKDDWRVVELDPDNGFRSLSPLEIPARVGDVEFWFESVIQAQYYKYVDYSGAGLADAFLDKYSESSTACRAVTNAANAVAKEFPTCGTDWFVRLRESASEDELWRVYVRKADGSAYDADGAGSDHVDFTITEAGSWRAFMRTLAPLDADLLYRVEQIRLTTTDTSFTWSTNCWRASAGDVLDDETKSVRLVADPPWTDPDTGNPTNNWSTMHCTATTGHLMFTLNEGETPTLSTTKADRQTFDGWNDANQGLVFVGTSTEDSTKSGAASGMKRYDAPFDKWVASVATNQFWTETFIGTVVEDQTPSGSNQYRGYTYFENATTPNGWEAGPGMWVHEECRETGMAYSMKGRGAGYMLFQNTAEAPRGIESIELKARLAQSLTADDIYYSEISPWGGTNKEMTNYTFVVQAAMSPVSASGPTSWKPEFDGPGQLSVFAGYRDGKGAYELRIVRVKDMRYLAGLYRWEGGKAVLLKKDGANFSSYGSVPFTIYKGQYPTLYISVDYQSDGSCKVNAGFSLGQGSESATGHSALGDMPSRGTVFKLCYWDANPPAKTWGSFGVASANCPAVFGKPRVYDSAATWPTWGPAKGAAAIWGGSSSAGSISTGYSSTSEALTAFGFTGTKTDIDPETGSYNVENDWTSENGNFTIDVIGAGSTKVICAQAPEQPLIVEWAPDGTQDWRPLVTNIVSTFELSAITVPVYLKDNAAIRIRHGGTTDDDRCVDITVDDVIVRQWRGDDFTNTAQTYFKNINEASPNDFVFMSAWKHEEGSVELSAKRTVVSNAVTSIRSPLMDGNTDENRGIGLGMFAFSYTNADSRAVLELQVATNASLRASTLSEYTSEPYADDSARWTTVRTFNFADMSEEKRAGGVLSHYLGLHGVSGVMRLIVPTNVVVAADASTDGDYGRVFITGVRCYDEPELGPSSWWGWNVRTGRDLYKTDDDRLASFDDSSSSDGADLGMSLALNNSLYDIDEEIGEEVYAAHQPFVQTPTFTNGTSIAGISFKARCYDIPPFSTARVCIYGANPVSQGTDTTDDSKWKYVTHFDISDPYYRTYTYKTAVNQDFEVLRFVVVGVKNGDDDLPPHGSTTDPGYGADPVVRVALDDIVVTEALRPKVAFKNVFAFRGGDTADFLDDKYVNGFNDPSAQPLAEESWGVQAEVYASQLPDEVDFDAGVKVTLYWYAGIDPWGFQNWETADGVHSAELAICSDTNLAFRSSYAQGCDKSVIGGYPAGTQVQYMLKVEYKVMGSDDYVSSYLTKDQWVKPYWYRGVDLNKQFGLESEAFSAYTLMDSVAPGWAWINEANIFGGLASDGETDLDKDLQYIEIAMPAEADITDWWVDFISKDTGDGQAVTNTACTFGYAGVPATKELNSASNCVFLVVSSPTSKANLLKMEVTNAVSGVATKVTVDGVWNLETDADSMVDDSVISMIYPIAMRLVRSSGVVEHEITLGGTNLFAELVPELAYDYSSEWLADALNAEDSDGGWVDVGYDNKVDGDRNWSLGETGRPGDMTTCWVNSMRRTPGFINDMQVIDPKHPVADGENYIVYADVDTAVGHITQTFGDATQTVDMVTALVRKGTSTNITYNIERWYELDRVSVDGSDMPLGSLPRKGTVTVTLGGETTSNNIDVVAYAAVDRTLSSAEWGLDADNRYTPAVVDWLNKGVKANGESFANPDGPLSKAEFHALSGNPDATRPLTLTEMYWLDIDPTESNWWFVAGMAEAPSPVLTNGVANGNARMAVYMCLTNTESKVSFAPYVLRGVEPGSLSSDSATVQDWDGPAMKIEGRLLNTSYGDDHFAWVGLRWFLFDGGSFTPAGSDGFRSYIEILDPYSTESPGYWQNWYKWKGESTIGYRWNISDGTAMWGVETLMPTNWFTE